MSYKGISKWSIYDVDVKKLINRLPKCFLAAKKEETVIRLLALSWEVDNVRDMNWRDIAWRRNNSE